MRRISPSVGRDDTLWGTGEAKERSSPSPASPTKPVGLADVPCCKAGNPPAKTPPTQGDIPARLRLRSSTQGNLKYPTVISKLILIANDIGIDHS